MPLRNWLGLLILILVIFLPIFAHLEDDFPLMLFDEGRLANSAIEMYETGNPLVVTYDYQPEMWSTKPPFLIWMQALSLKIFGIRDLSFRLPVSIAAVFTCIFMYFFSRRKLKAPWLGIIAATILVSTPGYVRLHGVRTGDYDGMLTLFTTISLLCFYLYIQEGSKKYFRYCIAALILGCLTKGIAGLMFAPAMVLYAVFTRKLFPVLKSKELYLALLAFIIFVPGYYLLREMYNPGYFSAVLENEVGGRFYEGKEGHSQPFSYYFISMYDFSFKPFLMFLPLGIAVLFMSRGKPYRNIVLYLLLCSVAYVLAISLSTTKHSWYVIPVLPLLAIIVALPIYIAASAFFDNAWARKYPVLRVISYIFIIGVCYTPLKNSINFAMNVKGEGEWLQGAEDMGKVFQGMLKKGYPYDHRMKAIFEEYQAPQKWYMKACRLKNIPVTQLKNENDLQNEDLLIVYNDSIKSHVETTYSTHVVDQKGLATIYQVHGRR